MTLTRRWPTTKLVVGRQQQQQLQQLEIVKTCERSIANGCRDTSLSGSRPRSLTALGRSSLPHFVMRTASQSACCREQLDCRSAKNRREGVTQADRRAFWYHGELSGQVMWVRVTSALVRHRGLVQGVTYVRSMGLFLSRLPRPHREFPAAEDTDFLMVLLFYANLDTRSNPPAYRSRDQPASQWCLRAAPHTSTGQTRSQLAHGMASSFPVSAALCVSPLSAARQSAH
jgi:hypothetical protein